jgi:transposase
MKLKNKIPFIIMCAIVFLTFVFVIFHLIINRKIDFLAVSLTFIAVSFSFILYSIYQTYKDYLKFEIKVDEEGLFFNIPKAYIDYYELEVPKGKFLWKQIKSVQYDSEEKIIYLILLSKAKIPIPVILFDKEDIEAILKEISKHTSVKVV